MKITIAIESFLNYQEAYNAEKTVKHYRDTLKYFIDYLEYQGKIDLDVNDITASLYDSYVGYLRKKDKDTGFGAPDEAKKLKKRTILTYTRAVKSFVKWLFDQDHIDKDISKKMRLIRPERHVELPLYESQVDLIDKQFNLKTFVGLRNWCIIHLQLDCGFRISEVMDLEINHIDFTNRNIKIVDAKGSKDRYVPLPTMLKMHLYDFIYLYRKDCDHTFALQTIKGTKLEYQGLKSLVARLKKKTGITHLKYHLLRHTFATCYIVGGGDISSLRIYMGHSSINTTDGYLHIANTYRLMGNDKHYKLDRIYYKRL